MWKKHKQKMSLKQWARFYLLGMDEQERLDFFNRLDPDLVWRMAEGNPKQETEVDFSGIEGLEKATKKILDSLDEHSSGKGSHKKQVQE